MSKPPLYLPDEKSITGITLWCDSCRTNTRTKCKLNDKPISQCPHKEKLRYKIYVRVPGSNIRRTKIFESRNWPEVQIQALQYIQQVKNNALPQKQATDTTKVLTTEKIPQLLAHALARRLAVLRGEGVPEHRVHIRSLAFCSEVAHKYKLLLTCLKQCGYDVSTLKVSDINDEMTGKVYEYLRNEKKYKGSTFNKVVGIYGSFIRWYSDEYKIPLYNWFEKIRRRNVVSDPKAITKNEYESLLDLLNSPEAQQKGIKRYAKGVKPYRKLFRTWLIDGIRLGLETGRRSNELIQMRFDNIAEDSNGISYIVIEDLKVNRIQNRTTEEEKKKIYVPVTKNLKMLLYELGYEKMKHSDQYILAPDLKANRTRIMSDTLARGFSHYFDQISDRRLTFKSLRKAYITAAEIATKGNARAISQHAGSAVIDRHYTDKAALALAAKNFEVFAHERNLERHDELEQIRHSKHNQKDINIHR